MSDILDNAKFGADGLIPAVIQDARTREVLTVAYMNKESLQLTLESAKPISGAAAGSSFGTKVKRRATRRRSQR
jgi:hypothetical protein